jgi:hypothetical protein
VRGAFSELLTSVGADPQDPQAMSRQFGLNKNLAWKISKIVQADDPSVALQQMPGSAGTRIFLESVERAGAKPDLLRCAREAIDQYEQLIRVHSGDRATLEMMGSELSPAGRQARDESHRKLLFQGASYVWGVQARVMSKVGLVAPGSEPGTLDFASLSALIDFRRLRPQVTWLMATRYWNNDDGSKMQMPRSEPIDPRYGAPDQAPLVADFCSQPLPELRNYATATGTSFELVEGPVGNTGAITCVLGTVQRGVPYYRTEANEWGEHSAICDTPAELLILDLFIHSELTFAIPPEPLLYGEMRGAMRFPCPQRERNRLPLAEPLHDLGAGPLPLATPEVPRYSQMVQSMFDRTRWDPSEFHGFRMKIAYPACPTALVLRYRLPDPPDAQGRTT